MHHFIKIPPYIKVLVFRLSAGHMQISADFEKYLLWILQSIRVLQEHRVLVLYLNLSYNACRKLARDPTVFSLIFDSGLEFTVFRVRYLCTVLSTKIACHPYDKGAFCSGKCFKY